MNYNETMQIKQLAAGFCILLVSAIPIQAEEITNAWDETSRIHQLRRPVPTAISVYTDGTSQDIIHEQDVIQGVSYDLLRVSPSEHTVLQIDYSETPLFLNELRDASLEDQGFHYAGGINGGFFSNTDYEYGRPVGAVRKNNSWVLWNGEECTPAYGSGYATAYFEGDSMWLKYHGWQNGQWLGDNLWTWEGYSINMQNGITGAYTYYANGEPVDITSDTEPAVDYRGYGRALTIFAQDAEKQYLLINIYGTLPEETVYELLNSWNVINALRLDGGGSAQMVYETEYVQETNSDLYRNKASVPLGALTIQEYKIPVHEAPDSESPAYVNATYREQHYVYSIVRRDDITWYRIGVNRWISGDIDYHPTGNLHTVNAPALSAG